MPYLYVVELINYFHVSNAWLPPFFSGPPRVSYAWKIPSRWRCHQTSQKNSSSFSGWRFRTAIYNFFPIHVSELATWGNSFFANFFYFFEWYRTIFVIYLCGTLTPTQFPSKRWVCGRFCAWKSELKFWFLTWWNWRSKNYFGSFVVENLLCFDCPIEFCACSAPQWS